jgi:hypothetical protein
MPLIRAVRGWMGMRMAVTETGYRVGRLDHAGWGSEATALTWLVLVVVALPVIAAIVVIGFAYELVVRLDRRGHLPELMRWSVGGGFGLALVTGIAVALVKAL